MNEAKWSNGKTIIGGRWEYYRPSDKFFIEIYKKDSITGEKTRKFSVYGDSPEWGKWKLIRE